MWESKSPGNCPSLPTLSCPHKSISQDEHTLTRLTQGGLTPLFSILNINHSSRPKLKHGHTLSLKDITIRNQSTDHGGWGGLSNAIKLL